MPVSIHSLEPLEQGGVIARQGFAYQDHVAVAFLLQMLGDQTSGHVLAAVWCEAEDDITLIWQRSNGETVEFVQVKRTELDQLWTAAKICHRESPSGGVSVQSGTALNGEEAARAAPRSLFEKSLAHDRCTEPCSFRVVTAWELAQALRVLRLNLEHPHREQGHEEIEAVVLEFAERSAFRSPNDNNASYWVRRLVWDVRGTERAVEDRNLAALDEYVYRAGAYLAPDQRRALYETLLTLVKKAAEAPHLTGAAQKKLGRVDMEAYLGTAMQRAQHPTLMDGGQTLKAKLEGAGLPFSVIQMAKDLRHRYRREILTPRYLSVNDRDYLEGEVAAILNHLLARFDAGALSDTPVQFHERCVEALGSLQSNIAMSVRPPLQLLHGAMYDLTHRCLHRFGPSEAMVISELNPGRRGDANGLTAA